ncbi:hypothetical protein PPERSA_12911 [Pseudocohnilembus persalinus]|uniref:Uncharacterized protein n=1 Tax=Pseudocohnilembus persalinus TaxID=266149 RepID=A0A0V0R1P2_PSEPJ|nr:hypothetical protein PPERSA_12911 [Pseudocohnilembus persalinus]|eukprot:KRX08430.1 hypothetical protein PPERSA_12911 [Pseudocohnilembus persalinus]
MSEQDYQSDSGSDMPEEVSFKTAKKQEAQLKQKIQQQKKQIKLRPDVTKQNKEIKIPVQENNKKDKKKQNKKNNQDEHLVDEQEAEDFDFDNEDFEGDDYNDSGSLDINQKKNKRSLKKSQQNEDFQQLIQSELPSKKLKELEGKYSLIQQQEQEKLQQQGFVGKIDPNNYLNKNKNKKDLKINETLQKAPIKQTKILGNGIKVVYDKTLSKAQEKPAESGSNDFFVDQLLFGNGKRRVSLNKIVGGKKRI